MESAVGSHLANSAAFGAIELYYWRDRDREVDFVAKVGQRLTAIEVKSALAPRTNSGLSAFSQTFGADCTLLVGSDGLSVEQFLSEPVSHWVVGSA